MPLDFVLLVNCYIVILQEEKKQKLSFSRLNSRVFTAALTDEKKAQRDLSLQFLLAMEQH